MVVTRDMPSFARYDSNPHSLSDLLLLSDEELARQDIASVNLLCAEGLPGADKIDQTLCLQTLDQMARRVHQLTNPAVFRRQPERWDRSEGIFRIHAMISVLQREFGVRYNTAKIPGDVPLDTDDCFIHGIIQGQGGTCGSLPILYAAVGRRLGYPLKVVAARGTTYGHLFARWDDPHGECFNIEVNNKGFDCPPDDHYRTGLYTSRPDWEWSGTVLKSMTPQEELAAFMSQRSGCWGHEGGKRLEAEALAWASALAPHNLVRHEILKRVVNEWDEQLRALTPPGFPDLYIHYPPRRFPVALPEDFERAIIGLTVTEFLLKDPINDRRWWEPMRRGAPLSGRPTRVTVQCTPRGYDVQVSYF